MTNHLFTLNVFNQEFNLYYYSQRDQYKGSIWGFNVRYLDNRVEVNRSCYGRDSVLSVKPGYTKESQAYFFNQLSRAIEELIIDACEEIEEAYKATVEVRKEIKELNLLKEII